MTESIRPLFAAYCLRPRHDCRRWAPRALLLAGAALVLLACRGGRANEPAADADNLYLARPGMSRSELGDFIAAMREKPATIRKRPGFYAATIDAANRLLALSTGELAQDPAATAALLAKFWALHNQSLDGDGKADLQLGKLAKEYEQDPRAKWPTKPTFIGSNNGPSRPTRSPPTK